MRSAVCELYIILLKKWSNRNFFHFYYSKTRKSCFLERGTAIIDSKEIAERALRRADEIRIHIKHRRKWLSITGIIFSVCAVMSVIVAVLLPIGPSGHYAFLDDALVPLSSLLLPDENAVPYTDDNPNGNSVYILPSYNCVDIASNNRNAIMVLFNPENNSCLFTFEIALKDDKEPVYTSELVEPGMCIKNPALSKVLEKGEHKAILTIWVYDLKSLALIGSASGNFSLFAE